MRTGAYANDHKDGQNVNTPSTASREDGNRNGEKPSFPLIFGLGVLDRLPLHVTWIVGTAAFQRHNVVNDIAGSTVWVPCSTHELSLGCFATNDPSIRVALPRLWRVVRHLPVLGRVPIVRPYRRAIFSSVTADMNLRLPCVYNEQCKQCRQ